MSAVEIINEIKSLPPEERRKVMKFARENIENLEEGQLPGEEIGALVQRMIDAKDPAEAKRLEEEVVRGFYGAGPHA